ncbi:MAG TPA: helix-turn-helix domain-containing protein [Pseudomonadales bacterium]|nr:helix-turn-helix domain-containing protein [Pseudomonadales bacterium]
MTADKYTAKPRSQQERSRRTEQILLDSALQLFRERGVDAVTVGDIASVAGVAPATIYRRFGDKDGLLREAFARFVLDSLKMLELAPAVKHPHFIQLVADVTALVLTFSRTNQRLLQSSYAKALVDSFYTEQLVTLRSRTVKMLKDFFLQFTDQIGHEKPGVAIDFALRQAMAMVTARMEAGQLEVEQGAIPDAVFVRELMRSILSYLKVSFTAQAIDKALRARGI